MSTIKINGKQPTIITQTMRYALLLALFTIFGINGYSQAQSKYTGVYTPNHNDSIPKLFILPDHQFIFISSIINKGTWKECNGNLIMYPDQEEKQKSIRLYGRYDDKFPADSIYFNFKELEDTPILYSFNNEDNKQAMHSAYNLFPNCFNISHNFAEYMSCGAVKRSGTNTIQFVLVPQIYSSIEFNNSKDPKFVGSISGHQQNFILPSQFNDYQVAFENSDDESGYLPFMVTLHENNLYINGYLFGKREPLPDSDKSKINSILESEIKSTLNNRNFSEYRYQYGYENWVDYEYQLITDTSPDINKSVSFDLHYLITENCNKEQNNDKYTSLIIKENVREAMSFWKTFITLINSKDKDKLITMIDFPLLKRTEENMPETQMSKADFLAGFDQLFSPYVMELFERCNFNTYLKDHQYSFESIDDDGRIYSLDFKDNDLSLSISIREKDQLTDTKLILKKKNENLKLGEISTETY